MNKQSIFILLVFTILWVQSFSQHSIVGEWKRNVKNSLNSINKSNSLHIDANGNCYVLGTTWFADSTKDILLLKYDNEGNQIWVRTYDNPSHGDDIPMSMNLDKNGNIWVCGMAKTKPDNADFLIVKFNPDGIPVSNQLYDGHDHLYDCATSIVADKQGFVYAAGYETTIDSGINMMITRYRPDGSLLWRRGYSTRQMDVANQLMVDDSSNVYVCGTINNGPHTSDILIQKYNTEGQRKWQLIFDGELNQKDAGLFISADDSMNIYVSGFINHSNNRSDIPLLKLNRHGQLIQENFYNGHISDCGAVNLLALKKSVFVCGSCIDYNIGQNSSFLIQYDKAGKEQSLVKAPDDVQFINFELNTSVPLVFGSMITRPDNTLIPYIAMFSSDSLTYTFIDSTVQGLAHLTYVEVKDDNIYFLGDDTGDATGTIRVYKYSLVSDIPETKPNKKIPVKKKRK